MKRTIALSLAAVSLLAMQVAQANDLNYDPGYNSAPQNNIKVYAGAGVGYTGQGSACNTPFFEGSCDESAMSHKIFTGARFNQLLGAELTYVDHGEAAMDGNVGLQAVASKNSISGYQLTGVGYLPLAPATMPNLDVIGKAGFLFWERETNIEINDANKSSDDGVSTLIGLGAQYQFHPNMLMRGEWEHTFGSGANSSFETDIDNYSMSLMYSTF